MIFQERPGVIFLLKSHKLSTILNALKHLWKKKSGLPIKCLRTDRGGEFNSVEFNDYCKQQEVKRQLTTAYTPQQNGTAERKNRTVMNLVRAMLTEKNIAKVYWPKAVQ